MTQNNLYMDEENMRLYVDVQPLFIDELESSKNLAVSSAQSAQQSEQNAKNWLDSIISYKTNIELFYAQSVNNLTNQLNNISNSISNAKNTALEGIETLKNNVMNSIQSTGQNIINQIIMYASDIQQTIDNNVSAEYLVQSNALESGCVSRINNVLDNIKSYTHSTFDASKFTVTGSPIITSDGIASGFSSSNSIYSTSTFDFSALGTWEMTFSVNITSFTDTQTIFWVRSTNNDNVNNNQCYINANKTLMWNLYQTPSNSATGRLFSYTTTFELTENTSYIIKFKFTGTDYLVGYSTDGINYNWETAKTSTTKCGASGTIQLGLKYASNPATYTTIDLKQFSINVDGVPVFSGNKTGIDTIKPDDYTVEGTPTISADGVASGFSDGNYIKTSNTISFSTNVIIYGKIKTGSSVVAGSVISGAVNQIFNIGITANKHFIVYIGNNSNWTGFTEGTTALLSNTIYDYKLTFDGNDYKFYLLSNNTWNLELTVSTTQIIPTSIIYAGAGRSGTNTFGGSIDLNEFKVYVNGDLIYQPCLKIPYTESKTGSKVVDIAYRSRVQDMYEQFGYAPYYTLSDVDFTLPMGDLYGMIENLRKLIIQRTS